MALILCIPKSLQSTVNLLVKKICKLAVTEFIKIFVFPGGDLATSACAYDPLFYPLHAYIDYLFSQWQQQNPDAQVGKQLSAKFKLPSCLPGAKFQFSK